MWIVVDLMDISPLCRSRGVVALLFFSQKNLFPPSYLPQPTYTTSYIILPPYSLLPKSSYLPSLRVQSTKSASLPTTYLPKHPTSPAYVSRHSSLQGLATSGIFFFYVFLLSLNQYPFNVNLRQPTFPSTLPSLDSQPIVLSSPAYFSRLPPTAYFHSLPLKASLPTGFTKLPTTAFPSHRRKHITFVL